MDDVLDNICTFYNSWSIYRYLFVLVSTLCPYRFCHVLLLKTARIFKTADALSCGLHPAWHIILWLYFIVFWRLPFYYELKIAFVVWLLSPYTKGSSVLYRKFVHPTLSSKEKVIYSTFLWNQWMSSVFFSLYWNTVWMKHQRSIQESILDTKIVFWVINIFWKKYKYYV